MDEYHKLGPIDASSKIKQITDDNPIYISFDLDCLDPSIAPAVF